MDDAHIVEAVDADEAFSLLSDASRIAVLRELWRADDHELSFSELREAVGVRDSGQFNYHLGKLTGRFVAKTDAGYELKPAGRYVVGALLAGSYTKVGGTDRIPTDASCPACGGAMTFEYEDTSVTIQCEECPVHSHFDAPPGVFADYDAESFPAVADRYAKTLVSQASEGFCPYCRGRTDSSLAPASETGTGSSSEKFADVPMVRHDCTRCDESIFADAGTAFLDHPAVVSFFYDHGLDVRDESMWRFSSLDGETCRIFQRDPLRATVTYTADGDELTLTVDESATVVETEN